MPVSAFWFRLFIVFFYIPAFLGIFFAVKGIIRKELSWLGYVLTIVGILILFLPLVLLGLSGSIAFWAWLYDMHIYQ